jgi:hypothetical protein
VYGSKIFWCYIVSGSGYYFDAAPALISISYLDVLSHCLMLLLFIQNFMHTKNSFLASAFCYYLFVYGSVSKPAQTSIIAKQIPRKADRWHTVNLNDRRYLLDSAKWYSTHTCSTLRGSTLKKVFPYNFFTLYEANTLVALPNAWRRSVRALS